MIGEGRGEILTEIATALPSLAMTFSSDGISVPAQDAFSESMSLQYEIQVITPAGISVSTAEAYGGITPAVPEVSLREALARPVEEWDGVVVNDFETTVFDKYPELAAIKRSLYDSGAVYSSMSGSGSALFAIYRK
jgi:4-diphosphocytidyl-2-C-methyl-D-erythritol kinase